MTRLIDRWLRREKLQSIMKQTSTSKGNTGAGKSIPKSTVGQRGPGAKKMDRNGSSKAANKYKMDAITKDNFDIASKKDNITEIG